MAAKPWHDSSFGRVRPAMTPEITTLILLTGPEEAPLLGEILRAHHAALDILPVHDRAAVTAACRAAGPGTRLIAVFRDLAAHIACRAAPLPVTGEGWSGSKTTLAQVDALSRITPDLPAAEAARRKRACGGQVTEVTDPGWLIP